MQARACLLVVSPAHERKQNSLLSLAPYLCTLHFVARRTPFYSIQFSIQFEHSECDYYCNVNLKVVLRAAAAAHRQGRGCLRWHANLAGRNMLPSDIRPSFSINLPAEPLCALRMPIRIWFPFDAHLSIDLRSGIDSIDSVRYSFAVRFLLPWLIT